MAIDQHDELVIGGSSGPARDHAPDHNRGAPRPYRDGVDDELHAAAGSSDELKGTERLSDLSYMDELPHRRGSVWPIFCATVCALLGVFAAQALGAARRTSKHGGHRTSHHKVVRRRHHSAAGQRTRCDWHRRTISATPIGPLPATDVDRLRPRLEVAHLPAHAITTVV